MYVYITCRTDIGYAITSLSKFSSAQAVLHYKLLQGVAKYLCSTMHWGIWYKRSKRLSHLPTGEPYIELQDDPNNPFPVKINLPLLQCFVDAVHGNNDLCKRRSTTGLVFTYCGGAVLYCSKTQTLTAGSSTEFEFIATVTTAKLARYLWSVLKQIGFHQSKPTVIFIDGGFPFKPVFSEHATEVCDTSRIPRDSPKFL
jgi:hypothetical protein